MPQAHITVEKANETFVKVRCSDRAVFRDIAERFTFEVPSAKHSPAFKWGQWDGKIRLLDARTGNLYYGLHPYVREFAEQNDCSFEYLDSSIETLFDFSVEEANRFFKYLNPHSDGKPIEVREHQTNPIIHAIRNRRMLLLSPTSSGKSLIIYCLVRYLLHKTTGNILIAVPTTALVEQMARDFRDYSSANGWSTDHNCHLIYGNKLKETPLGKRVVITTWQSIFKLPSAYFQQFDVMFGDEAHNYKAKSLISIMEKLTNCRYKFGTTGTLQDTKTDIMQLEGLFGQILNVITTKELMEKKMVAELVIHCLVLKYPEQVCRDNKKANYEEEIAWLTVNEDRNRFIRNLALSLKGNTLILFRFNEHGRQLYSQIKERCADDRQVFYIDKDVKALRRVEIGNIMEGGSNHILVASYGTTSTGISIKNIDNVILASFAKSKIRVLQSIGRGLRISDRKTKMTLFDIVDDMQYRSRRNFALQHYEKRLEYYNQERFRHKEHKIALKT